MTRSKATAWVGLTCLAIALMANAASAQSQPRASRGHEALNQAVECNRRGDYEQAAQFLRVAQDFWADLTSAEQNDLRSEQLRNATALAGRKNGADQVKQIEEALKTGNTALAGDLLKKVVSNPYLTPEDKQKAAKLGDQVRPRTVGAIAGDPLKPAGSNAAATAKSRLQEGRSLLARHKWDEAEAVAREVDRMGVTYASGDDTPQALLKDVEKARSDPKQLLVAARAALSAGDYDRAELLATAAEKNSSSWSLHLWGDSPAQVRKDIQAARAKNAAPAPVATTQAPPPPAQAPEKSGGMFASVRGMFSTSKKTGPETTATPAEPAKPTGPGAVVQNNGVKQASGTDAPRPTFSAPSFGDSTTGANPSRDPQLAKTPPAVPSADKKPTSPSLTPPSLGTSEKNTQEAKQLIAQARKALQGGDHAEATKLCEKARALRPNLAYWDDTPDKVLADIQRAKSAPVAKADAAPRPSAPEKAVQPETGDPRQLLKKGRELLSAGKLDEAATVANHARAASTGKSTGILWGLFEDSPDKLMQDIDKARSARDREESVRVLAEGRRKFEMGDLPAAEQAAYKAQKLHGNYSVWDLGDRPNKLLADVQSARDRQRKPSVPPLPGGVKEPAKDTAFAQNTKPATPKPVSPKPDTPPAPAPVVQNQPPRPAFPELGPVAGVGTQPTQPQVDPKKQAAVQLLSAARLMQKDGKLIEARQKVLEAQAMRVQFSASEESPEQVLLQLSSLGYQRVESLKQEAADHLTVAAGDPARYQKAEANLAQARQLCVAFGFDAQPIDARLAQVRQQRATTQVAQGPQPPVPMPALPVPGADQAPGQVRVVNNAQPPQPDPNADLLQQARVELSHNDLVQARKLAILAFQKSQRGSPLQVEAEGVLRSIDTEEWNQRRAEAKKAYEAGCSAFNRRDFSQASTIFKSLDSKMLGEMERNRMAQICLMPEMQPGSIARNGMQQVAGLKPLETGNAPVAPPETQTDYGHASLTDQPEKDLMTQTRALQDIAFQKLRQDGLQAQREAAERFKAGDTEMSLGILQQYLEKLNDVQLDSDRVALLRRPVDARLMQFKNLKQMRDFEKTALTQRTNAHALQGQLALVKQNKEQKVKELMEQHQAAYKDGKYREAEMYAVAAHDLDPDNVAAAAAIKITQMQRNQAEYKAIKEGKEEMFRKGLNDAEDESVYVNSSNPVVFDKDITIRNARERKGYAKGVAILTKNEKEREIEHRLSAPVNLNFTDTPLDQAIEDLRTWQNINIYVDTPAIQNDGVSLKQPVTMKLENISLKSALNLLLHQAHLTYVIKDEVLQITTESQAIGKLETRTFQVADLVIPVENFTLPNSTNVMKAFDNVATASQRPPLANGSTPFVGPYSLPGGQAVSPGSQAMAPGAPGGPQPVSSLSANKGNGQTLEDLLIKLITNTIKPESWSEMGGKGTIDYFPLGMALVINQQPDVQEQIQQLLDSLRRLQELEVAVEIRLISLAEGFYERIGLDFNINIKTDRETARFEPQITQQAFKPPNFINDFNPDRFIAGLTPAGTLTSDLDIPIQTSSYGMAIPPFGGFPNIPGGNGGIELGLAFLSDIQVFLFMEAAQGDQRTNVMQAPKLTLFNGQFSFIFVQDQQFFVTNVTVVQAGGQLAFVPQTQNFAQGISVGIQAVVSADRRFVRLALQPTITNLASAIVPLFPIVTPITPQFEGGFQGQPILFTQFIQQPVFNTVSVATTVSVPDGGTVLLGGLKRMSEGRNEFGPPILSKIPYVNRLFKNVGFGRETESLLMMVTPRIIINEEEEYRQTGIGVPPGGAP